MSKTLIATIIAAALLALVDMVEAYDIEATWTSVDGAEAYAVTVGGVVTAIVPGGDEAATTTVSVQAIGYGDISAPSNTLTIPSQLSICERMDVDGQPGVTATDVARVMQAVMDGECQ